MRSLLFACFILSVVFACTRLVEKDATITGLQHDYRLSQRNLAVTELALEITKYQLAHGHLPASISPFTTNASPSYGSPGDDYFLAKYAARWTDVNLRDEATISPVTYDLDKLSMNYRGEDFGLYVELYTNGAYTIVYCPRPGVPVGKTVMFENVHLPKAPSTSTHPRTPPARDAKRKS